MACPCGMIRSLLQRVHIHSYCNREHKREPKVSVHHCRASAGLAGCKADFINPAVLLVAQVSSLVLKKRIILRSARTAKTHGELVYACQSNGPDSARSYVGCHFSCSAQILCRHTEVWTIGQSCSVQKHKHINPEHCCLRCWFHSFLQGGIEFCRGFVCFLKKNKTSGIKRMQR